MNPELRDWLRSSDPNRPDPFGTNAAAREALIERLELRDLGGPGSGNFGHIGRPGLVGGSVASGPKIGSGWGSQPKPKPKSAEALLHGTPQGHLQSILKDGLKSSGVRQSFEGVSESGKVYMTTDPKEAETFGHIAGANQFDPTHDKFQKRVIGTDVEYVPSDEPKAWPAVLEIEIPKAERERIEKDANYKGEKHFSYSGDIKPEWIKSVRIYDPTTRTWKTMSREEAMEMRAAADSTSLYMPIILGIDADGEELKSLGGPGSGNFGHAGRPGVIGGSVSKSGHAGAHIGEVASVTEYHALKREWATLNDELFTYVDNSRSPEALALIEKQKTLVKQMHRIKADPGGIEGIGLPGGPRDVVIIGAGPGGLAAGVMGGAEGLDTLVVEKNALVGGQARYSSRIENLPGYPVGVTGERLASDMHTQAERMGAEVMTGISVTGMEHDTKTGLKTLTFSDGTTVQARSVIISGGLEFDKAPWDDKDNVTYGDSRMLAKHGVDKFVVVAGGSNGAAQAALLAAKSAKHVTLVSRKPIDISMSDYQVEALHHNPTKITVLEGEEISGFDGSNITLKSGRSVQASAVGVFFGGTPQTKWLPEAVAKTPKGKILTENGLETGIPGVFAVGDMRDGSIGRIGTAIGDGQLAIHSVFQHFKKMKAFAEPTKLRAAAHWPEHDPSAWDAIIDRAYALDEDEPFFSQMVEGDELVALGGPGSGNFGHAGRPGVIGGSAPVSGGSGGGFTADQVMKAQNLDPNEVKKIEERIRAEATTENERKYAGELAVAEAIIDRDAAGGDTFAQHSRNGAYTTERLSKHDQVVHQYFKDRMEKYRETGVITIDPDSVKPYLDEYNDGLGSNLIAKESGDIADKIMVIAAKAKMNIVIDGTMKTSGVGSGATMGDGAIGKMLAFKEAGYRVETRFVDVSVDESIQNTVGRFHDQFVEKGRGRYVPTKFSRDLADPKYGTKPRASFELAKEVSYKGEPLIDAFTHRRGWTGDQKTSNTLIETSGTLTLGGDGMKNSNQPVVTFMAGMPGAGKSTSAKDLQGE